MTRSPSTRRFLGVRGASGHCSRYGTRFVGDCRACVAGARLRRSHTVAVASGRRRSRRAGRRGERIRRCRQSSHRGGTNTDLCQPGEARCTGDGYRELCTDASAWIKSDFVCTTNIAVSDETGDVCATKADGNYRCFTETPLLELPPARYRRVQTLRRATRLNPHPRAPSV